MTITAIDPGPVQSAIVSWNGQTIIAAHIMPNEHALNLVRNSIPNMFAIEMVASYGMPVGVEVFETCVFIGRLVEAAERAGINAQRVVRLKVKLHHCHDSRAKDSNIRQALIDRFGAPGTKGAPGSTYGLKADMWQAFALAVYAFDTLNTTPQ